MKVILLSRKVLSKTLTEKSELLLTNLEQSFRKRINFIPIKELGIRGHNFGSVDTFSFGPYKVWLREDLPDDIFETNMFHELHHIWQIENSFPTICNKDTALMRSDERPFFEELGSHLSIILDFEVNAWLDSLDFSSKYFFDMRYLGLMDNKDYNYNHLDDKYNFAELTLTFIMFFYYATEEQKKSVQKAYGKYPLVLSTAKSLSDRIKSINPDMPNKAVICMGLLIDNLSLWDTYFIEWGKQKIRTAGEFKNFSATYI